MEPHIQYTRTTDGVSIAFSTLGKGTPLVQTPVGPCGVLQVEWQIPPIRAWDERVAQNRMLVKYDMRGTGLSTRGTVDCSLDALVRDVKAVVDFLELPRFALMGSDTCGSVAIAYAARYPERVSHLILWYTYARASDFWTPQTEAIIQLVETDWTAYTEVLCHWFAGWSTAETTRQLAEMMRKSVTPEEYLALHSCLGPADVSPLLAQVQAPTLVLHRRQSPWLTLEAATYMASHIPDAELVVLEGASGGYALEDSEPVFRAVDEFIGEGEAHPDGLTRREVEVLRLIAAGKHTAALGTWGANDCGQLGDGTTTDRHTPVYAHLDTDDDGCCLDHQELGEDKYLGGQRDPLNFYDFFDVPVPPIHTVGAAASKNGVVFGEDLSAILFYGGVSDPSPGVNNPIGSGTPNGNGAVYDDDNNGNGIEDGLEYDLEGGAAPPGAGPNGTVFGEELSQVLFQGGDDCTAPP